MMGGRIRMTRRMGRLTLFRLRRVMQISMASWIPMIPAEVDQRPAAVAAVFVEVKDDAAPEIIQDQGEKNQV